MRIAPLLLVPLLALACGRAEPEPAPRPAARVPLAEATLACPAQYRFDRAGGTVESALVLGDGPLVLRGGVAEPRAGSRWVLLDGLGATGDLTGDGIPETVVVVNWSSAEGTGSVDHLLVLAERDDGPACLAAIALGDRERLLRVAAVDGAIVLDGFTRLEGEPLATERVLARLAFAGDPAAPGTLRAARVVHAAALPLSLERLAAALAPTLALPEPEPGRNAVYASGGTAGVDARVSLPGPRAVELVLRLPAADAATSTVTRLLSAADPACAPSLDACLASHRAGLAGATTVRFAWCTCGSLATAAWGRAGAQVVTVVPALPWPAEPS